LNLGLVCGDKSKESNTETLDLFSISLVVSALLKRLCPSAPSSFVVIYKIRGFLHRFYFSKEIYANQFREQIHGYKNKKYPFITH